MDIKVGTQTWGPDASQAKQKNEATKYSGTKGPFGFRLVVSKVQYLQTDLYQFFDLTKRYIKGSIYCY